MSKKGRPKIRKIAILNFKGGTGKITTAVNLSHALALKRQNVLVVDCDPQGSVADWLGVNPKNTFFDLLTDREGDFDKSCKRRDGTWHKFCSIKLRH